MTIYKICEHGKVTIRDAKPTGSCQSCDNFRPNQAFYTENLTPKFNQGLGVVTCGTRDAEKKARARGLVPVGDAKPHEFSRTEKRDTITPILEEGRRKIHNLGSI